LGGAGSAESLLHEADTAMYHAKALGGDRVEVFDVALGRQVDLRAHARQMLESALADGRLLAHFQPIVKIQSRTLAGFEALARIEAVDGTVMPPADFIPVAEDSGLVVPLGSHILGLACEQAAAWQRGAHGPDPAPCVAVNLSARQFDSGDLPVAVREVLLRTGLPPDRLHLELLETAILDLRPDIIEQLVRIRELGVELGLDDFGTGYASLTHLNRLPLTFVKVDRSFVSRIGSHDDDLRIVSAVVDLAANLGLRSVAEGVETPAQLDCLDELGCVEAQGYLFSRPMPANDLGGALVRSSW